MHKTKFLFLLTLFCHTVFSSDIPSNIPDISSKQLTIFVEQPHLVAWLDNYQAFMAGKNGYEIVDATDNSPVKQVECENVWDVAVNKKRTRYAVSLDNKIECSFAADHKFLWKHPNPKKIYTPITFNSQDDDQVIGSSYNDTVITTIRNTKNENVLYFLSPTKNPISCSLVKTEVVYYKEGDVYTTTQLNAYLRPHLTHASIIGVRYTPDGNHIILNLQNQLQIQDADESFRGITHIPTPGSCIAFECCNNSFIAVLTKDNVISYCPYKDITQPTVQYRIPQNSVKQNTEDDTTAKRLSLSPDGTRLLIALPDRCIVAAVPLVVICGREKADKLFTLYCLLRPFIELT